MASRYAVLSTRYGVLQRVMMENRRMNDRQKLAAAWDDVHVDDRGSVSSDDDIVEISLATPQSARQETLGADWAGAARRAEDLAQAATGNRQEYAPSAVGASTWAWYLASKVWGQLRAVLPISVFLMLFRFAVKGAVPSTTIILGIASVVFGLALFLEGFEYGIMPMGEVLGRGLPVRMTQRSALCTTFCLGIVCTLAEPAVGALELAGNLIDVEESPFLWLLLNRYNGALVSAIGVGVGVAAFTGTLRLLRGWRLKPVVLFTTLLTLVATHACVSHGARELVGLAWDTGAVTTGVVTVPIVLGMGVGIKRSVRSPRRGSGGHGRDGGSSGGALDADNALDGFGIVTLASLFPVCCVLLLGIWVAQTTTVAEILEMHNEWHSMMSKSETGWLFVSPVKEITYAIRAIVPLIALLTSLVRYGLGEQLPQVTMQLPSNVLGSARDSLEAVPEEGDVSVRIHPLNAVGVAFIGLIFFNLGLRYGLDQLGDAVGAAVPLLFAPPSPLFSRQMGLTVAIIFTFFLGLIGTCAEPALNAMGSTTERLTRGQMRQSLVVRSVAVGVAGGVTIATARMVYNGDHRAHAGVSEGLTPHWHLDTMLYWSYAAALLLAHCSSEEFVAVAWDSAGVTTGAITVPLVLALGLGLGNELEVHDAFGLLTMASVGPILSVQLIGIAAQMCCETDGGGATEPRNHRSSTDGLPVVSGGVRRVSPQRGAGRNDNSTGDTRRPMKYSALRNDLDVTEVNGAAML